jgi:16S rRNA (adenine1518-N6/adenine1519-N6)-dimethyltransferase
MTESFFPEQSLLVRTRELLERYELKARKSLGQHFLINSGVLKKITAAADLSPSDIVIEIGPGPGVLTAELVKQAGYVIAVEVDNSMVDLLKQTFYASDNLSLIAGDVLDIEPQDLIQHEKDRFPEHLKTVTDYKLVANLPYYITQPIIRHFCEAAIRPRSLVIMVQKEVAKNIVALPGDLSIMAISVQYFGKPQIIDYVPAANFYPAPRVDSAILKIEMYDRPIVEVTSEKNFFKTVKAGFSSARKQVANSLSHGLDIPKAEVISLMQTAGVEPQKRAEMLTLSEWARLEKVFAERKKENK